MITQKTQDKLIKKAQDNRQQVINKGHEDYSGSIEIYDEVNHLSFLIIRTESDKVDWLAKVIAAGINSNDLTNHNANGLGIPTDKGLLVRIDWSGEVSKSEQLLSEWVDWYIDHSNGDATDQESATPLADSREFLKSRT